MEGGLFPTGALSSAELYDPHTGTFSPTGSMTTARAGSTAILLRNGLVLIIAGYDVHGHPVASAELYHTETGTFSPTGSMAFARVGYTATPLANGCALIVGGSPPDDSLSDFASAELYDPTTGTFAPTGSLRTARHDHTATLLSDGRVLVAGGGHGTDGLASAEIYDPQTGVFSQTGSMASRGAHTATRLLDGRVLLATGGPAELYDPKTGKFTPSGAMVVNRMWPTATLLQDGRVLIVGGYCDYNLWCSTAEEPVGELYDPATGTFSPTVFATTRRMYHTATLLPDGRVLIAGGIECQGTQCTYAQATLWRPD
jgi:hypothetical protein